MTAPSVAALAWQSEQPRLLGIAYRMLGDYGHAEDVVSEVGLEAVRAEREGAVRSWPAWLTTVCVRRAIDRLRSLARAREEYPGPWLPEPVATDLLPEEVVAQRELLSIGLLHLAEQLSPESRAALVLHRAFAMTAVEIAEILDKTPAAVRQLVSRAERRLQVHPEAPAPRAADPAMLAELVTALERGEIGTLLRLLEDDAILWTDGGGVVRAALNPIYGAERIVRFYAGVYASAQDQNPEAPMRATVVPINGELGLDVRQAGRQDLVTFDVGPTDRLRALHQIANPDKLTRTGTEPV
ncbi:sigma-70 family RNA polymerase sigma factor [Ruania zhangjianzhongii]|uniref:sigma-70 family RNA polymerase sigma factor n=1 Tax=Ruania zhangjianzhongii TaxID=2603206 RepID=UPI0011CC60AC|nr:sigma-70 family RNA polymerase sigma factor [Ruania zhangjianzhongii]